MLQPEESETAAVRAVFIMDPEGKVRLIMYYPLNVGRNMDEIKQQYWHFKLQMNTKRAMILKRQPEDKAIVLAPKTIEVLAEIKKSDLEMVDWYLTKKIYLIQPLQ